MFAIARRLKETTPDTEEYTETKFLLLSLTHKFHKDLMLIAADCYENINQQCLYIRILGVLTLVDEINGLIGFIDELDEALIDCSGAMEKGFIQDKIETEEKEKELVEFLIDGLLELSYMIENKFNIQRKF